ncbi:MAG: transglutaminase domain-containing protein [Ruminococcus sp.]|nr:transglutaminase domain-containing protein [Ruminococcus sp.]
MKNAAAYFKNRINLWLLPLLLSSAVGKVLIDCYASGLRTGLTIAYFFYSLVLFMLFDLLHRRRLIGGILYVVFLIGSLMLSSRLIYTARVTGAASMNFEQWFYATFENEQAMQPYYVGALFIAGGFFMASVIYYFTQIRYRAFGTLLAVLIPFVIYAKREDTMSDLTVTVLITLYIAVMVHNKLFLQEDRGSGTVVNTAYVLSVALFVSVSGALAMIFPDFSGQSRLEKDASFLNFGRNLSSGDGILNSDHSSKFHGAEYTGRALMYLYPSDKTTGTIYLRRRSMNAYDPETGEWYVSRDLRSSDGPADMTGQDFMSLYSAMEQDRGYVSLDDSVFEGNKYDGSEESFDTFEVEFADDLGSVNFLPVPLYGVPTVENEDISSNSYTRLYYGDMYGIPDTDAKQLGRVEITVPVQNDYMKDFASKAGSTNDAFFKDIDAAGDSAVDKFNLSDDPDLTPLEALLAGAYAYQFELVRQYYHWSTDYLDDYGLKDYDRIKALADDIVKDCKTDYEKIKAIEGYFTQAGFVYDLDYIPEDESLSYFLFESKTGICIDYASAMTVMLTIEDIPCRYVEGFVAHERDDEDPSRIVVRDYHAHAFVEAFVPYVGWMTFEPTVAGFMDINLTASGDNSGIFEIVLRYLGRVLIVLGVLFVTVFVILFDRIWEFFFRIRLRFDGPEQGLIRLYKHIIALLQFEDKTDLKAYTVEMLDEYILSKTGESLREVTSLFEVNRFGRGEITTEHFEKAFDAYKALYPKLRKKYSPANGTRGAAAE